MKGTEKGCVMNQNDAQGTGDTESQDAAEADTLDDRSGRTTKRPIRHQPGGTDREGDGMTWLARLKKTAMPPEPDPTKPTKPLFVGFVGTPAGLSQKSGGDATAANEPAHAQDFDGGMSGTQADALALAGVQFDAHAEPGKLRVITAA